MMASQQPHREERPRHSAASTAESSRKPPSHVRRKRPPKRLSQRPNDIYINRKSDFSSQLARCHKLLDQGVSELFIHGLGAAIHRAINLSLQLKETSVSSSTLEVSATTSTVDLVDDYEPVDDDADYQAKTRNCSAIHIRLCRQQSVATPAAAGSQGSPSSAPFPTYDSYSRRTAPKS